MKSYDGPKFRHARSRHTVRRCIAASTPYVGCHFCGDSVGLGCDGAGPTDAMTPWVAESTTRHAMAALKPTAYLLGAAVTRCSRP